MKMVIQKFTLECLVFNGDIPLSEHLNPHFSQLISFGGKK